MSVMGRVIGSILRPILERQAKGRSPDDFARSLEHSGKKVSERLDQVHPVGGGVQPHGPGDQSRRRRFFAASRNGHPRPYRGAFLPGLPCLEAIADFVGRMEADRTIGVFSVPVKLHGDVRPDQLDRIDRILERHGHECARFDVRSERFLEVELHVDIAVEDDELRPIPSRSRR